MGWIGRFLGLDRAPKRDTAPGLPEQHEETAPSVSAPLPLDDREVLEARGKKWKTLAYGVSDRAPLPIMPGREQLTEEIFHDLVNNPEAGRTHTLEGAPGAGKTATLNTLKRKAESLTEVACVACHIEDPDQHSTMRILQTIGGAFGVDISGDEIRRTTRRRNLEINLGGSIPNPLPDAPELARGEIRIDLGRSDDAESPPEQKSPEEKWFDEIARAYRKRTGEDPHQGKHRALILIDEAQNADEANHGPILRTLHTSNALPIKVVIAGLGGTRDLLKKLKISRIDEERHIPFGALPEEKNEEAIRKNIEYGYRSHPDVPIDLDSPGTAKILKRLAEETQGWPQHIATAVRATWSTLASHRKWRMGALEGNEIEQKIVHRYRTVRDKYYKARFEAAEMDIEILEAAMKACDSGKSFTNDDIHDAIMEKFEDLPKEKQIRHVKNNGETSQEWIDKMVRAGVLQKDPDAVDARKSPIPSMRAWIGKQHEEAQKHRGKIGE